MTNMRASLDRRRVRRKAAAIGRRSTGVSSCRPQAGGQMRRTIGLALVVLTALGAALTAQAPHGASGWTPPKTPYGQPSLQGVWTNATITPFERPPALAAKTFLTEAEAAQVERQAAATRHEEAPPRAGDVGNHNPGRLDSADRVAPTPGTAL